MRPVHPFPARMAPEAVSKWLDALPSRSRVLDPMCGSGVVLRQSLVRGHDAIGFDLDPLAVLMSRVWTNTDKVTLLPDLAEQVMRSARRRRATYKALPSIKSCPETSAFVEYWFAEPQRTQLARIVLSMSDQREKLPRALFDGLLLAFSRIIVTKQTGASLAWDVSHSRPHKKRDLNDFDVAEGFIRSAERLAALLGEERLPRSAKVQRGDGRNMSEVRAKTIDAVVTSPPYLNAIDYLRGHKLSLVWMGFTIPYLRDIRAGAVGTENTGRRTSTGQVAEIAGIEDIVPKIAFLPVRQKAIVHKYANDSALLLMEMKRVLKPGGKLVLVLADSVLRGIEVQSSSIFAWIAKQNGFQLETRETREIPQQKRYLPINSSSAALGKRMRHEIIQTFSVE